MQAVGVTCKKLTKAKKKEKISTTSQARIGCGGQKTGSTCASVSPVISQTHENMAAAARTWREAEATKAVSHLVFPSLDERRDGNNMRTCRVEAKCV